MSQKVSQSGERKPIISCPLRHSLRPEMCEMAHLKGNCHQQLT